MLAILSLLVMLSSGPSIYDFSIQKLDSDETISLADFKGKKILFVNVASKCGYTPQYEDLQKLAQFYKDELVVLGLPCDQFMGQELNKESDIKEFCSSKYNVTFPMTTVIDVKGSDQHPIYQWLTSKDQNGLGDFEVGWNFNKFLVDENGKLLAYFPSKVTPLSDDIINYLK